MIFSTLRFVVTTNMLKTLKLSVHVSDWLSAKHCPIGTQKLHITPNWTCYLLPHTPPKRATHSSCTTYFSRFNHNSFMLPHLWSQAFLPCPALWGGALALFARCQPSSITNLMLHLWILTLDTSLLLSGPYFLIFKESSSSIFLSPWGNIPNRASVFGSAKCLWLS